MKRSNSPSAIAIAAAAAAIVSLAVTGCGTMSHEESMAAGNGVDRAFAAEMIVHHEMAIEMAEVAEDEASRPQVKQLAATIIAAQQGEIDQLQQIEKQLSDDNVKTANLGIPASMMGMNMDATLLRSSKPFDRAFSDMMIPHHQGAIRMARVELAKGKDPQLRQIAQAIIADQTAEIEKMNAWRKAWYGAVSPAGGVPAEGEEMNNDTSAPMDHSMDHG